MIEYIKNTLVDFHKTCGTDKYGQVGIYNFTSANIFKDRSEEVEAFCALNSGILQYSTYASKYGAYRAFRIVHSGIYKACQEALSRNENYIRNLNS
ncbi:MAG: hypothetical protein WCT23_10405, partial [Candidatus Neomarinimicrobiota bacterium]